MIIRLNLFIQSEFKLKDLLIEIVNQLVLKFLFSGLTIRLSPFILYGLHF